MIHKCRTTTVLWSAMILILTVFSPSEAKPPSVNIGIVLDGPSYLNDEVIQLFKKEITGLLSDEFDVNFPEDMILQEEGTPEGIRREVERLLTDSEVDILITLGIIGSNYVAHKTDLPKPVLAPVALDAGLQGLPMKNGTSGVKNLNYLSVPTAIRSNLETFLEVVPYSRMAFLFNFFMIESMPELGINLAEVAHELGIEVIFTPSASPSMRL